MIATQTQAANLKAEAAAASQSSSSSSEFIGWSIALPPEMVGRFIGFQGRNIQELERSLQVKRLSVVKCSDGHEFVRIVAANQASVATAQCAIEDKVQQMLPRR